MRPTWLLVPLPRVLLHIGHSKRHNYQIQPELQGSVALTLTLYRSPVEPGVPTRLISARLRAGVGVGLAVIFHPL